MRGGGQEACNARGIELDVEILRLSREPPAMTALQEAEEDFDRRLGSESRQQ